jgi:hypothetical protein
MKHIRSKLIVLPADKPKRKIGWTIQENIGIGVFNPGAITRLKLDEPFKYLFELILRRIGSTKFFVYYYETKPSYFLVAATENVVTDPNGNKIPMLIREVDKAKHVATYIFYPDGGIAKDRFGDGSSVFDQIKNTIDVHQVMVC